MKSSTPLDVSIDKELAKKLFIVVNSLDRSSYSSRNEDLPQHWSEALGAYNEAVDHHDTIDQRAILCTTADASTVLQSNKKMNTEWLWSGFSGFGIIAEWFDKCLVGDDDERDCQYQYVMTLMSAQVPGSTNTNKIATDSQSESKPNESSTLQCRKQTWYHYSCTTVSAM